MTYSLRRTSQHSDPDFEFLFPMISQLSKGCCQKKNDGEMKVPLVVIGCKGTDITGILNTCFRLHRFVNQSGLQPSSEQTRIQKPKGRIPLAKTPLHAFTHSSTTDGLRGMGSCGMCIIHCDTRLLCVIVQASGVAMSVQRITTVFEHCEHVQMQLCEPTWSSPQTHVLHVVLSCFAKASSTVDGFTDYVLQMEPPIT